MARDVALFPRACAWLLLGKYRRLQAPGNVDACSASTTATAAIIEAMDGYSRGRCALYAVVTDVCISIYDSQRAVHYARIFLGFQNTPHKKFL